MKQNTPRLQGPHATTQLPWSGEASNLTTQCLQKPLHQLSNRQLNWHSDWARLAFRLGLSKCFHNSTSTHSEHVISNAPLTDQLPKSTQLTHPEL